MFSVFDIHFAKIAVSLFIASLVYGICLVIYRLTLHPLAKFPGPKLAAATRWYETYYDILSEEGGRFAFTINEMHDKYGPIVRINPDEVHIKDSDFYSTVYHKTPQYKFAWAAGMVGAKEASFGTQDHDWHHTRRAANTAFLSKRSVLAKEHVVKDTMEKVVRILHDADPETVIDMHPLLLAYTSEAVWQFSLEQSQGLLDSREAQADWREMMHAATASVPILRQFDWVMTLGQQLPLSFLRTVAPPVAKMLSMHEDLTRKAEVFLKSNKDINEDQEPPTIFHAIYSSSLPPSEKTAFRLSQEAFTITAAAGNTTAHHLSWGIYYLVSNPSKLAAFRAALDSIGSRDAQTWTTLQNHPYIRATMKEILRLRGMTSSRSPMQFKEPIQYKSWTIPAWAGVSLTVRDVLLDPEVFGDPDVFRPERWLEAGAAGLERYYVPFARGPRICQGLEFAYCEMYRCLGALFSLFDFEIVDMDYERDLAYKRDCLVALPGESSRSVRVKVRSRN